MILDDTSSVKSVILDDASSVKSDGSSVPSCKNVKKKQLEPQRNKTDKDLPTKGRIKGIA